jgi:hypothetical protein
MTRQARFGGMLDHGHEAAVYRNENKTLAIFRLVTYVAEDLSKRYYCLTFRVWAILTKLHPLSENVTVCNSVAVALFVTIVGPWLQNHGCKVRRALIITMVYVFDSYIYLTSIIFSIWAAMADIKFHGDVIFLFSPCYCCCCDDETYFVREKCSVPRMYGKSVQYHGRM